MDVAPWLMKIPTDEAITAIIGNEAWQAAPLFNNASEAIWWPNVLPMQVPPSSGQENLPKN